DRPELCSNKDIRGSDFGWLYESTYFLPQNQQHHVVDIVITNGISGMSFHGLHFTYACLRVACVCAEHDGFGVVLVAAVARGQDEPISHKNSRAEKISRALSLN